MNLLALDTSTDLATVALKVGGETANLEQAGVRQHAQHLLPMIQTLLSAAALTWGQLDGIVFGAGPGSFTGLRIACAIAKALAYAHQLPVYPVRSLDAITYQVRERMSDASLILAALDARMHEVYWGYYPDEALMATSLHVSAASAVAVPETPVVLAGWGLEGYQDHWPQALQDKIVARLAVAPTASALLALVDTGAVLSQTAEQVLPVYIRDQVTHRGA